MKEKPNQLFLLRLSNERYFGAGSFFKAFELMFHKSFMISFRSFLKRLGADISSRISVFSTNTGKYGPENIRIWTLFTQCVRLDEAIRKSSKCLGRYENKLFAKSKKAEAAVGRCSSRQFFLKISQIPHKNTCEKPYNFIKQRLHHKCFPVKFDKFLGTPFLQNTLGDCF